MKETKITNEVLTDAGFCAEIYGEIGCGKTTSLLDLPDPLLLISVEAKDIKRTIKEYMDRNGQKSRKIKVWEDFKSFDEMINKLNDLSAEYEAGKKPFNSIGFDSLSFNQQVFKIEMEDSRYKDRLESKKRVDTMIDKFRMEQADWGGIKSSMIRLTRLLNSFAKYHGVYVVATSGMTEYPKWDKSLEAAPNFEGGYSSISAGFFDLVGFVQKDKSKPDYPYPPMISFVGDEFVTRCCSDKLIKNKKGPLHWGKIISVLERKGGDKE